MGDFFSSRFVIFSILINGDHLGRHGNQEIITFQNVLFLPSYKRPLGFAPYTHSLHYSVAVAR